jgi:hypothetical protein|nr:MAG TPA: Lower collar protein [Caudoviricetes sp.]
MAMSKYTTEVRYICEQMGGYSESQGGDKVDDVLEKSWNKIFDTSWSIFDEQYRKVLCKKILKHYYTREIGAEVVGLWILWLNRRMCEIMPYYNQLYESEKLKFDPLTDTDITTTSNRKIDTENNATGSSDGTTTNNNVSRDLYSDTPQGALQGVESETYLTNARKISDTSSSNDSNNYNSSGSGNSNDDYFENVKGKRGGENYSDMLRKYRETFLNIDMMIIEELGDLFFNLW